MSIDGGDRLPPRLVVIISVWLLIYSVLHTWAHAKYFLQPLVASSLEQGW